MKTSTFEKGIPMLPRLGLCLAVLLGGLALFGGCYSEGNEGDRCNPLRSSDECGSGLVCSGNPIGIAAANPIEFCPENYCCPPNGAPSSNPNCQPGCNGGASAICSADPMNADACAFASGDAAPSEDGGTSSDAAVEGGQEGAAPEGGEASVATEGGQETSAPEGGDASASD